MATVVELGRDLKHRFFDALDPGSLCFPTSSVEEVENSTHNIDRIFTGELTTGPTDCSEVFDRIEDL